MILCLIKFAHNQTTRQLMMRRLLTIIAALFFAFSLIRASEYEYGLKIQTYPLPRTDFTGLILEGGKSIDLNGDPFKMQFMLFNRPENVFGTIFRIITDKGDNIDLMYSVSEDDQHYPMLVTGEYVHDINASIPTGCWIPVSIGLNPKNGEVVVDYAGTVIEVKDAGTKGAKSLRIAFGRCMFQGYVLDDVASVNIRDIMISRKDRVIRHWDLSIHDNDICFDNIRSAPTRAVNACWIVDQYISWNVVHSCNFSNSPSVAFDPQGVFYMTCDGKTVNTYDTRSGEAGSLSTRGGAFPTNAPNQLAFTDAVISYNLNENTSARLDQDSGMWVGGQEPVKDHDFYNNAVCYWESEDAIVSFGGYGHYRYNNKLLIQYPGAHEKDYIGKVEEITPRYGSTVTVVNDTLYVFGGRGNLSGKQELSPRYYYDLYAIDLKSKEVTLLWSINTVSKDFVLGEQMIYDREGDCFYALSTIQNGTLIKFSRHEAGFEEVSLPCGFTVGGQYSTYSLFRNKEQSRLYAVLTRSQITGESSVQVAEMNWPPVTRQLLHTSMVPAGEEKDSKAWGWILCSVLLMLCGVGATVWHYERKGRRKSAETHIDFGKETQYYDFSRNSICFFGGFSVRDRDGRDITSLFTPNLKALTLLLLLHSSEDSPGISSSKLNRTLWSYKPEESANNNRNVYISKLRSIFEQMDGFTIVNKNKLWEISMSGDAQCDWIHAKNLLASKESQENILRLVELLLRGPMLPNSEYDWLVSYKGEFSNLTIDLLSQLLDRNDVPDDLKIKVANTIFMHDFLNEDALRAKCHILYKAGKTGLAKTTYDNFCEEYRTSIGMDFEISFKELI